MVKKKPDIKLAPIIVPIYYFFYYSLSMKYELDTIPVWDAYKADTECSLCFLKDKMEKYYLKYYLGNSVMTPEIRIQVNETGFCPMHLKLLNSGENSLGLSLMMHTYTMELKNKLIKDYSKLTKSKGNLKKNILDFKGTIEKRISGCLICNNMEQTLRRYAYTIIYLRDKDKDFNDAFDSSKGFCFHHFAMILDVASEVIPKKQVSDLINILIPIQEKNIKRIEDELYWYIQKYDYRNTDKPWGNSKDAIPRIMQKLTGYLF